MTNTISLKTIRQHLRDKRDVERVRYVTADDAWHCYGRMPNSIETGWWFAGTSREIRREIDLERSAN